MIALLCYKRGAPPEESRLPGTGQCEPSRQLLTPPKQLQEPHCFFTFFSSGGRVTIKLLNIPLPPSPPPTPFASGARYHSASHGDRVSIASAERLERNLAFRFHLPGSILLLLKPFPRGTKGVNASHQGNKKPYPNRPQENRQHENPPRPHSAFTALKGHDFCLPPPP